MKIIVMPIGSFGDVHPLLGIGVKLRERGHDIVLATNGHFEGLARKAGIAFEAMGTAAEYDRAIRDPDLWHPAKATKKVMGWAMAGLLRPAYEIISKHFVPGETMVVAGALALGARVAHEKLGVPLVTAQLQPLAIYSRKSPPLYAGMPTWFSPWMIRASFWFGEKMVVNPAVLPTLNAFRAELDLAPLKGGIFTGYLDSPQLVLGLFADWFAGPPPDWPAQLRMPGFPLFDEKGLTKLDPELESFLKDGSPPIVFTPGSAFLQGKPFFSAAAEACSVLGRRGLLLSRYPENIPGDLPPGVRHFAYAPFSDVLPRSAALVHHGGIGTMAQAFAAGIPQLVMPMAHDQPDNARRAQRLGVALAIDRSKFVPANVAAKLRQLLEDPRFSENAKSIAKRLEGIRALDVSCDHIEELARRVGMLKSAVPSVAT
jgi:UDP:flavonoid glycosyltransferase YjiC (YdhE family)